MNGQTIGYMRVGSVGQNARETPVLSNTGRKSAHGQRLEELVENMSSQYFLIGGRIIEASAARNLWDVYHGLPIIDLTLAHHREYE
jgi:hypothetical protein